MPYDSANGCARSAVNGPVSGRLRRADTSRKNLAIRARGDTQRRGAAWPELRAAASRVTRRE